MEIRSENFGPVVLKASVRYRDDGVFYWEVTTHGSPACNPASGSTIFVRPVDDRSGEVGSAHEAEFAAAAALVAMASEQRERHATAEAKLASRNSNHAAAVAATERLSAL